MQSKFLGVRLDPETGDIIAKLAVGQSKSKSEIARSLIDKGMKAEGLKAQDDRLYEMVKTALSEIEKPHVERLAAISAKATQIGGAAYFMLVLVLKMLLPEEEQEYAEEAAARARQLGIEYLKLRNTDIDAFLRAGIGKMQDN